MRDELGAGPMWAKQIFKDAHDAGISQGTLYIAKSQLRVRSEKVGTDGWQWALPREEDDKPSGGARTFRTFRTFSIFKTGGGEFRLFMGRY